MTNLLKIYLSEGFGLNIEIGGILIAILALLVILFIILKYKGSFSSNIELNIGLGNIGNIKIKPNHTTKQIAHKCWTELMTRKAGLLFDEQNDLIVEVYDSWYVLFKEIRNLIKEIPAEQVKNKEIQKLVNLMVDALNKGLRPHLTERQSKFRYWYNKEIEKDNDSPQEVQKKYPYYYALIQDLKKVNYDLCNYGIEIKKLI